MGKVSTMMQDKKALSRKQWLREARKGEKQIAELQGMLLALADYFGQEEMDKFFEWYDEPVEGGRFCDQKGTSEYD